MKKNKITGDNVCQADSILKDIMPIFGDKLIAGNHDTISLLGANAQGQIANYSKAVSNLLINKNDRLEEKIENALLEIDNLEKNLYMKLPSLFKKNRYYNNLKKQYYKTDMLINEMIPLFELQRAQLIKEVKIIEKLYGSVTDNINEIKECIIQGEKFLITEESCDITNEWYLRLDKKIGDLRISQVAANQIELQLKLLCDNNKKLLDSYNFLLLDVLPLWKKQSLIMIEIIKNKTLLSTNENNIVVSLCKKLKDQIQNINILEKEEKTLKKGIFTSI